MRNNVFEQQPRFLLLRKCQVIVARIQPEVISQRCVPTVTSAPIVESWCVPTMGHGSHWCCKRLLVMQVACLLGKCDTDVDCTHTRVDREEHVNSARNLLLVFTH
jgi:hypothetical protein